MKRFGEFVVKHRAAIFIISILLLIPAAFGYFATRINYDILYYLPKDIETMEGQDILMEDFGKGAYALFVAEDMSDKDVSRLKKKLEEIDHVADVIWYDSILDLSTPQELLPDSLYSFYNSDDATLMAIFFDTTTSADETMDAIEEIRKISGEQSFLSGMSAIVTDTKLLVEQEIFIYVAIAAVLALIVMTITLDSFLVPVLFLLSIGMAIVYNLGSNVIKGEISFITMAMAAVLQLAVTMDYSIFLYESYNEQKKKCDDHKEAMASAIAATLNSVVGSSLTTVAGFIALCFMTFTLGADLGVVMAKGVVIGVICCVTLLPSLILLCDKAIEKTSHKPLNLSFHRLSGVVTRFYPVFAILMVILWVPSIIGYNNMEVYYKLDESLPENLPSVQANRELDKNFDMNSVHMVLLDGGLSKKDVKSMAEKMKAVDGVDAVLGLDTILGSRIPSEFLPEAMTQTLHTSDWQLILITSEYATASDEVNSQIEKLSDIVKSCDEKGMVIGEAACTKDLISITDHDFAVVNAASIAMIFVLIAIVLGSVSLPVILVLVIELAIYINLGLCFYTGTVQSFIASVVIGTIQLGATVDYAILMTNRYKRERLSGSDKRQAARTALEKSIPSIITSAMGFFAATIGVGIYSDVDLISSLCLLMARGALISMVSVIFLLPSMYMLFDGLIIRTTRGMSGLKGERKTMAEKSGVASERFA